MVGSRQAVASARTNVSPVLLVLLLFGPSMLLFVPTAAASVSGDLAIIEGLEPRPGATYDMDTSFIRPEVKVRNELGSTHAPRDIRWEICSGNWTSPPACPLGSDDGFGSSGAVPGWQQQVVSFSNTLFQPWGTGLHTIVFMFTDADTNTSNDRFAYTFDVESPLRDISVNSVIFDNTTVMNSNTPYPLSIDLYRRSWAVNTTATFGWMLYNDTGVEVANNSTVLTPPVATSQHYIVDLPDFVAPYPGDFELEAGLLDSAGDMNDWNDMASLYLSVNDSLDVWVETIRPARGPGDVFENMTVYPYGEDSVRVDVGNIGHVPVDTTVFLSVINLFTGVLEEGPTPCNVYMLPGETAFCKYNLTVSMPANLLLRADFSSSLVMDINPSDNWFQTSAAGRLIDANPTISEPIPGSQFDSGQSFQLIGQVSTLSANPVNFTWKLNYEEVIGYGPVTTASLPMGDWLLTLHTRDALNRTQYASQMVRILNRISLVADPWIVSGEAVLMEEAEYTFPNPDYPPEGLLYSQMVLDGIRPLRTFDIGLNPVDNDTTDLGIQYVDVTFNLSQILPDELPRDSLRLYRVASFDSAVLEEVVTPNTVFVDETADTLHLNDLEYDSGLYVLGGDLELANVSINNLEVIQGTAGKLTLEWEPGGDLDNPYFSGWRLYRRTNFPFLWPYSNSSQFSSVLGTEVANLSAHANSWEDPELLEPGTCAVYLLIALDRQGEPDYAHGMAAGWDGQDVNFQCGDAVAPDLTVSNMEHEITYDNTSGQNIHHVNITWIWPDLGTEVNVTWSLYRVEIIPGSLLYVDPLATDLWGDVGEEARYHDWEGPAEWRLKVNRTYHYILVPTDHVGNTDYTPLDGNIETLELANQYWDHHQDLIPKPPPEPETPMLPVIGEAPWLLVLYDYMAIEPFQSVALIALAMLLLNLIAIPLVINRTRGVRRVIKSAKRRAKGEREELLRDEMAGELDDMFR